MAMIFERPEDRAQTNAFLCAVERGECPFEYMRRRAESPVISDIFSASTGPSPLQQWVIGGGGVNPTFTSAGYPTDETLEQVKSWNPSDADGLFDFISKAWKYPDCFRRVNAPGVQQVELVTGGWSGNEDLVNAMQENYVFWSLCWVSSERGGRHVFEVPNA